MKIKRLFVLFLFLGCTYSNVAQIEEIPFTLKSNGHIYLKVTINDSKNTLNFVFDTGAAGGVLDKTAAGKLGIRPVGKQSVPGAGSIQTYNTILPLDISVTPDIIVTSKDFILADLAPFRELSDTSFDGIIGYSLLKQYITKIDYEKKKLSLFKKIEDIDISKYKAIPFDFSLGITIPQFDISIQLKNGEHYSGKVFFDSGAGSTLYVNTPFHEKNNLGGKVKKSISNEPLSLGNKISTEKIGISSLHIDEFVFTDLTISLFNSQNGVGSYPGYLGILGAKIIERFHVVLDYSNKMLYLKPNRYFKNAFEFPLSGIRLKKVNDSIYIRNVAKISQAYKNGLRKGDKILSIDTIVSDKLSTYIELLMQKGKTVNIKVQKPDGQIITYSIKLVRLL